MAHTILEGQAAKLVGLDKLGLYHHTLLSKLGLVNDTAEFQYNGVRGQADFEAAFAGSDEELDPKKINDVVSKIYDLAKAGSISFAGGKSADATLEDVEFDSKDSSNTNEYWIHAQVGDDIVNIKFDASAFVKDSFLDKVEIVTVAEDDETGKITYKVGDAAPTTEAPDGFDTKYVGKVGTYFFYTWKVENGEAEEEPSYTTIAVKDIYGDLEGDDYITVADGKISANTAEVKEVKDSSDSSKIIAWNVDSSDSSNLATAENLATVATSLQEQLNAAIDKLTLVDGTVTLSDSSESSTLTYSASDNRYELTLAVASDTDIANLFTVSDAE